MNTPGFTMILKTYEYSESRLRFETKSENRLCAATLRFLNSKTTTKIQKSDWKSWNLTGHSEIGAKRNKCIWIGADIPKSERNISNLHATCATSLKWTPTSERKPRHRSDILRYPPNLPEITFFFAFGTCSRPTLDTKKVTCDAHPTSLKSLLSRQQERRRRKLVNLSDKTICFWLFSIC